MGKRGGFPGGMGGFGGMNLNQLMKEAKKMQSDMEKSQEELGNMEFDTTAGGGAVYVKVNGAKEVQEIKIKKDELSLNSSVFGGGDKSSPLYINSFLHFVDRNVDSFAFNHSQRYINLL